MTTINNLLELYSLKGNVASGKIILFQNLENKNLGEDEIKNKVVDEYQIMGMKHFIRSWKEYQKMKRWINIED
tara:strand:+ start:233 stop:451 length:219 start_codon:yes stop_codon:yes gene_type:complete